MKASASRDQEVVDHELNIYILRQTLLDDAIRPALSKTYPRCDKRGHISDESVGMEHLSMGTIGNKEGRAAHLIDHWVGMFMYSDLG